MHAQERSSLPWWSVCGKPQLSSHAAAKYKPDSSERARRTLPPLHQSGAQPRSGSRSHSSSREKRAANAQKPQPQQPTTILVRPSSPSLPSLSLPHRTESPPPSSEALSSLPHYLHASSIASSNYSPDRPGLIAAPSASHLAKKRSLPSLAVDSHSKHSTPEPSRTPQTTTAIQTQFALTPFTIDAPAAIPSEMSAATRTLAASGSAGAGSGAAAGPRVMDSRFPSALGPAVHPGGMPAPFPKNEDERVQALLDYRVMDTHAEAAFDQLAVLASQICQTPIALVSLVDHERQWFKARIGLDPPETSRDLAFCAHAILQDDVFEIPDASSDWRFSDSPLVTGAPNIRFYAGMPLINNDGFPLGTLCAIDTKPKQLNDDQKKALRILSAQTVAQLELRRHVARLTETMVQVHDTKKALESQIRESELARREAEKAKAEAESANRAKSDFLANMSHEIRTPMNGVLGMATLLSQTSLSKEQSEYVSTVQASGEHLLTVLNDILDYSKQESGKLELENLEMDLYTTIEQAVELAFRKEHQLELIIDVQHPDDFATTQSQAASAAGGEIVFPTQRTGLSNMAPAPVPPALPTLIMGDVTRLRQVAVNIISNSCKFTPQGGAVRIAIGVANRLAAAVGAKDGEALSYEALETLVRNGDVSKEFWNRLHAFNPMAAAPAAAAASGPVIATAAGGSSVTPRTIAASQSMAPASDDPVLQCQRFLELQVSISDSGIGIPPSKIHKLFKAFSQLDASTTREYGGTGLGLAISAKLVHQMGGQIWVESEVGHGSTFSFTIITPVIEQASATARAAAAAAASDAAAAAASASSEAAAAAALPLGPLVNRRLQLLPSSPKLVVLVAPSAAFAANLSRQMQRWGLEVRRFADSCSAATWFQSQDPATVGSQLAAVLVDYIPKLVVAVSPGATQGRPYRSLQKKVAPKPTTLDDAASSASASLVAPGCDVNELAQLIRLGETKADVSSSVPIYYLSCSQLLPEEIQSVEDLGVCFVRKPILLSKLRQLLQSCVVHKTRSPVPTLRPAVRKLAEHCPLSILVAEDNKVNMKLALKMLETFGYRPVPAYNGAEAVELVVTQRQHFDLILCDMIMPVKDGLTASQEILDSYTKAAAAAAAAGSKAPPQMPPVIIAMTASAMEADRKSCSAAGMVDFVAKPVNLSSLRQKIEQWAEKIMEHRSHVAAHMGSGLAAAAGPAAASALPATGAGVSVGGITPSVAQQLKPKVLPKHA